MRIRGQGCLLLCLSVVLPAAIAVTPSASAAPDRPPLFRRLTTEHGLSDSTVEAIVQDTQGFMWFGTADGLNRYDGYTFKVYSHVDGDPTSISGNYVWDLLVDSRGTMWVGTDDDLNRYVAEQDSFVAYRHDPSDPASLITSGVHELYEDSQDRSERCRRASPLPFGARLSASMNRQEEVLGALARLLDQLEVPYMVVGGRRRSGRA